MKNPLDGKYVYITKDAKIADGIMDMLERKTGGKMFDRQTAIEHPFQNTNYATGKKISGNNYKPSDLVEMTIAELEALPDYQPLKKMTVAEICKELGYDVEIVKEK